MATKEKYGFKIVNNDEELEAAKANGEVCISVKCKCCDQQKVIPIEKYGMTCEERKNHVVENIIT